MSFRGALVSQGMKINASEPEQQSRGCKQYLVPVSTVILRRDWQIIALQDLSQLDLEGNFSSLRLNWNFECRSIAAPTQFVVRG